MTADPALTSSRQAIQRDTVGFDLEDASSLAEALARLLATAPTLLALGEPMHGGEEFLRLRNRLFQRLVEHHGFRSIVLETSFVRALAVDAFVAGHGGDAYGPIAEHGFSHGFGTIEANRALVEWMRAHNGRVAAHERLTFHGYDPPTEATGTASPRRTLEPVLDYLAEADPALSRRHDAAVRERLGEDAAWENPRVIRDRSLAVGRSPEASALRLAVEDLLLDLGRFAPKLAEATGARFAQALHLARLTRSLLGYHAAIADGCDAAHALGLRDAMGADTMRYVLEREHGRGGVFLFAHNAHVQRGEVVSSWYRFWPVGAHLASALGSRYLSVGTGVGVSPDNGIGPPEADTLEALLIATPGRGHLLSTRALAGPGDAPLLPVRSGSPRNPSYSPLGSATARNFDAVIVLNDATYTRGAAPLRAPAAP